MLKKLFNAIAVALVCLCSSSVAQAQLSASINSSTTTGTLTQTFVFRVINGNTAPFQFLNIIIAPPSDLNVDACYFIFKTAGNSGRGSVKIFGDYPQINNYQPWSAYGDGTDVANSQCTVKGSQMSYTVSGNDLFVTVPVVASNLMLGNYNIFLSADGNWNFGQPDGYWQPIAQSAWPSPPTSTVLPVSGQGMNATFDTVISSTGVGHSRAISRSLFIVNQYASGVGACYVIYTNSNRQLIMLQDSGNNVAYNGTVFLGTTPHASQIANNTLKTGSA